MFALILLLPLMNFILIGLCGRFLGYRGVMRLTLLNILISFITSCIFSDFLYRYNSVYYVKFGSWLCVEDFSVDFSFCIDKLSLCMLGIILIVSYTVHLYSCLYMKTDPHFSRFMSYLSLFTFFMLVLVSADNMVLLFVGWEGVGLCSYLLIGFWNTRIEANKASIKALVINRIGDISLLLGMVLTFYIFRTLDFDILYLLFPYIVGKTLPIFGGVQVTTVLCLLFLGGVIGKSAQIGLHVWLPDAMEGPTPVSALIHAATMVTAGIYLCIRLSFILEFSSLALNLMIFLGSLTAFTAGLIGFLQSDIKKIIAYSTCTQLGYMFVMCGLSQYDLAFYHLINHAFFKALLFLSGGVLIHIYKNQDLRKMSGLRLLSSFIYAILLIGTLASDGFFFFSSVESKDIILEISSYTLVIDVNYCFSFGIISLFLTICYNSSLLDLCSGNIYNKMQVFQIDLKFIITLTILAVFTLLSNYFLFQAFVNDYFSDSIFINIVNSKKINAEVLPYYLKFLVIMLFGILNIEIIKEKTSEMLTVNSILLVYWVLLGSYIVLALFHGITIIWDSKYQNIAIQALNFYLHSIPFWIFIVGFLSLSKEINNYIDFYNIDDTVDMLYNKFYYDWIINFDISEKFMTFAYFLYKIFDKGILELLGPEGLSVTIWNLIKNYKKFNSGYIYNYSCIFLIGILYIITIIEYFF